MYKHEMTSKIKLTGQKEKKCVQYASMLLFWGKKERL